jgi:hypothetical protein
VIEVLPAAKIDPKLKPKNTQKDRLTAQSLEKFNKSQEDSGYLSDDTQLALEALQSLIMRARQEEQNKKNKAL